MTPLWKDHRRSQEEALKEAIKAKPSVKFRSKFLYNNVMYLAAGKAAGNAANSTWERLIELRISKPLRMNDTNVSHLKSQGNPQLAIAYSWDKKDGKHKAWPVRGNDVVAPAGAVVSNGHDMSRWLRFLINEGELEGLRLISHQRFLQTKQPQIEVPKPWKKGSKGVWNYYGMGWFIGKWHDQLVISHGGGIDGFCSQIVVFPDLGIGFALLINSPADLFNIQAIGQVSEILFDV